MYYYYYFFTIVCVSLSTFEILENELLAPPSVQSGSRCLIYNRSPKTQILSSKHGVERGFPIAADSKAQRGFWYNSSHHPKPQFLMYIVFGERNSPTLTGNYINQLVVKITLINLRFSYQILCFENTTFYFYFFS